VFKTLVKVLNLSPDMKVVESGWGTKAFETGALDALAAFEYDEPIQLDLKKIGYKIIRPEAAGCILLELYTSPRRNSCRRNPKVVQGFIDDLVGGWAQAIAHPKEGIDKVAAHFKDVDVNKELLSFERGRPYFSGEGGRLLYASAGTLGARWRAIDLIGRIKVI